MFEINKKRITEIKQIIFFVFEITINIDRVEILFK